MNLSAKLSALGVAAVLSTAIASATPMQFGSYSTADPPNAFGNQNTALVFNPGLSTTGVNVPTTTNTVDISPGSVWHPALPNSSWVSWGPTGPTTPPNFAPNGNFVFQSSFTLPAQATSFTFSILADDTVQMYLDGNTGDALFSFAPGGNNVCQNNLPNCLNVDTVSSDTLPPPVAAAILALLTAGTHTVSFNVLNNNLIDMGLDFSGSVDFASPVPEPSSLLLLGTGLIGSAGALLRRARARV
jgi:hypothetical protein